jgi:hypothetical protein
LRACRTAAGEEEHVLDALLEAGRIVGEQDHRPRRAHAEQADARPDVECARDAIFARGQEDDARPAPARSSVERLLDRRAVVGLAVANTLDGHGGWIVRRGEICGRARPGRRGTGEEACRGQQGDMGVSAAHLSLLSSRAGHFPAIGGRRSGDTRDHGRISIRLRG